MLIKENGQWRLITFLYVKTNGVWTLTPLSQLSALTVTHICNYGGETETEFILSIIGPSSLSGDTCTYNLLKNGITIPSSRVYLQQTILKLQLAEIMQGKLLKRILF